jgi:hypothetical protein
MSKAEYVEQLEAVASEIGYDASPEKKAEMTN